MKQGRSRAKAPDGAATPPEAAGCGRLGPFFAAAFDTLDTGICFLDRDLRVVAVNPALRRLLAARDFLQGRPCQETPGGLEGLCGRCPAAEALASGRPVSRLFEDADAGGNPRHLEVVCHPLADAAGRIFGAAEVVRDVTRRRRTEREMLLASQDIEMLLSSIRSILVGLDGQDQVRRFNASAEKALGLSAEAAVGRNFFDIGVHWEGQAVSRAIAASRQRLEPVRVDEVRCRTPSGGERLLGLTVNPVPAVEGAAPGVLILGQDLSDIKVRELKAFHERRMQAIGRLAAGIAHEINTPIQYVGYNAGFLDEAFGDLLGCLAAYRHLAEQAAANATGSLAEAIQAVRDQEAQIDLEYLREEIPAAIANTRKGIRQVTEIVSAMRQMSHPGTGEMLFFDCNAAVRDIVTVTRNAWKHVAEVDMDLAGDLPLVYGLPHEVSQVLLNVILNAAQAVEERVSQEPWTRGRIGIATGVSGGCVVVSVSDTGPGIAEAVQARIFDPFFTTKEAGKGTGQGLAISQAVMARHGGGIDFQTRLGEGTTFFVRFPAGEASAHERLET